MCGFAFVTTLVKQKQLRFHAVIPLATNEKLLNNLGLPFLFYKVVDQSYERLNTMSLT